jgi:rhodanese-related sulfurtransferase
MSRKVMPNKPELANMSKGRLKWMAATALAMAAIAAAVVILPAVRSVTPADQQKLQRIEEFSDEYRKSFPNVPEMTVAELLVAWRDGDTVLLDVRKPAEQEVSMIPGAILAAQFEREPGKYKTKRVVVYCTVGYRSGDYAKRLLERGKDARNLRGGILAWVHAGQPVVHDGAPTRRVHVYGPKWDLLPEGWESVK